MRYARKPKAADPERSAFHAMLDGMAKAHKKGTGAMEAAAAVWLEKVPARVAKGCVFSHITERRVLVILAADGGVRFEADRLARSGVEAAIVRATGGLVQRVQLKAF